ncbi:MULTISPECIES: hypothetical protein [Massilia]|uniref:Uncharacterized protein n=1 Tax=Massilia haematophila TaxID=457923 RepID=A0ABV7PSK4_9BURK|nr:hypothetical protein [Massilia sp.]
MASIENRSRIQVTVKNRDDLTKQFAYSADKAIQVYVQKLRDEGLKPRLTSLNDHYVVRTRSVGAKNQCIVAHSEAEAIDIKHRLESELRRGCSSTTVVDRRRAWPTCWFATYARKHRATRALKSKATKSTHCWKMPACPGRTWPPSWRRIPTRIRKSPA